MTRAFFRTFAIFLLFGLGLGVARFNSHVAAACHGCTFMTSAAMLPAANINQPYAATLQGSGGVGAYTFTRLSGSLPNGVTFNNGVFSGTPTQPGSFTVRIEAADENGCKGVQDFTLQVNCPTIDLSPTLLATGTYGTAYANTIFTPTGGFAPYTFTVSGLPAGMTFSATSSSLTIGGTPTQSGSFNVVVKVTDGFTCGTSTPGQSYALTINKAVLTVHAEDKTKVAGAPLPALTHVARGFVNNDMLTVLNGALATTATENSNAGIYPITQGTLAAANYTINFTNGTLTVTCPTFDVLPKPTGLISSAAYPLPTATLNQNYTTTIAVTPTGGKAQFAIIAAPNVLPAGLTLDANSGVISGKPTVSGTFVFRVQATAFGSCIGSRLYSIKVNAAASLTAASVAGQR